MTDQGQHVGAEVGLQLGVLEEVVEDDAGDRVPLEHDDQPLAILGPRDSAERDMVPAGNAAHPRRLVLHPHQRFAGIAGPVTREHVLARYRARYAGEALVRVQDEAPWVSRIAGRHHVALGGVTWSEDGQRLVVVLKRDAVARVVLNNLFKHTELQTNFSANMLALVCHLYTSPSPRDS